MQSLESLLKSQIADLTSVVDKLNKRGEYELAARTQAGVVYLSTLLDGVAEYGLSDWDGQGEP